jgi:O-methyltransferase involved in polyketide biosynthesis
MIDDYVVSAVANGIPKIVILGAGFDSRAYRIAGAERSQFFEVDHPNTSAVRKPSAYLLKGNVAEFVDSV